MQNIISSKTTLLFATLSIILTSVLCISCKKTETITVDGDIPDLYSVPITMTLDGVTATSTFNAYLGFGNNNCQVKAMQGGADSPNFTFTINNFSKSGSTINGNRAVCDKTTIEVLKGNFSNGLDCYTKESDPGSLTLSGKTYTLKCKVYGEVNNVSVGYLLTATWTVP